MQTRRDGAKWRGETPVQSHTEQARGNRCRQTDDPRQDQQSPRHSQLWPSPQLGRRGIAPNQGSIAQNTVTYTDLTAEERRDLIAYGYEMKDKAKRARTPETLTKWTREMRAAWQMANYHGA